MSLFLSDENKADLLRFIDSHLFQGCCALVAAKAAAKTDFARPAADLGVLLAREKGINEFPALLRELCTPSQENHGPPSPKTLRPEPTRLRP